MLCSILSLVVAGWIPPVGMPKSVDKTKVREALRFRVQSYEVGIGINMAQGFIMPSDHSGLAGEIALEEKRIEQEADRPEGYARLAELYARNGDAQKAAATFLKAAELYRAQAQEDPPDACLLSRRAEAL